MKFPVIGRLHGTIVAATGRRNRWEQLSFQWVAATITPCKSPIMRGTRQYNFLTLHDDPESHNAQRYKRTDDIMMSIADPTATVRSAKTTTSAVLMVVSVLSRQLVDGSTGSE